MPQTKIYDRRHAAFMESFITASIARGFRLHGCEVPYNHYGNRGVVDVLLRKATPANDGFEWHVCELKPVLADIGEAIRQVQKSAQYFRESRRDLFSSARSHSFRFPLVLEASAHNFQLWREHSHLFRDIEVLFHHEDPHTLSQIENLREIEEAIHLARQSAPDPPPVSQNNGSPSRG